MSRAAGTPLEAKPWGIRIAAGTGGLIVILLAVLTIRSQTLPTATVGTLAAMVGLVGAVGGLLVGVMAVLTLTQIDRQVEAAFSARYEEHREALARESAQWAKGIRWWTQAAMTDDLSRAAACMRQALDAWPDAPGARTEMVRRLWMAARTSALWNLLPQDSVWHDVQAGRLQLPPPVNLLDVHQWWTLACDREPSVDAALLAEIGAGLYALCDQFEPMRQCLEKRAPGHWTVTDEDCLIWGQAVHNAQQVSAIQALLPRDVPFALPADTVVRAVREHYAAAGIQTVTRWYTVLLRPSPGQTVTNEVLTVAREGTGWVARGPLHVGCGFTHNDSLADDDALRQFLTQHYLVIRQVPLPNTALQMN